MTVPVPHHYSTTGAAVATSREPTKPVDTADNDLLEAMLYVETDALITAPAGWTLRGFIESNAVGASFRAYFYRKRASSEPASWVWSWTGAAFSEATVVAISGGTRNGDPTNFETRDIDPANVNSSPPLEGNNSVDDCLLLWFHVDYIGGAKTPPAGFTELFDGGAMSTTGVHYMNKPSQGSTGSLQSSYTGAPGPVGAQMIALEPEPVVVGNTDDDDSVLND